MHAGIDLRDVDNPIGAPILAAAAGIVVDVRPSNVGAGNRVIIRHHINGRTYYTLYAHMELMEVDVNQQVSQGERIGTTGATGVVGNPIGHLHFEIHLDYRWNSVNPRYHIYFPRLGHNWHS